MMLVGMVPSGVFALAPQRDAARQTFFNWVMCRRHLSFLSFTNNKKAERLLGPELAKILRPWRVFIGA